MDDERKVRVRLKVAGIDMEVECSPEDIEETIKNILSGIKDISGFKEVISVRRERPSTCKEVIEELWRDGWFSEPRSLS
ncbi:hypothetical protein DRN86_02480 [Candidatus Geothermarchaeota archaeon]|nr:MAG: hypothetical protein DRN86_02480 [Candidatus Geothermarchaeota archaeon]